jgi:hypothetical protein
MASPALETIFNCDYAIGVPQKLGFDLLLKRRKVLWIQHVTPKSGARTRNKLSDCVDRL